MSEYINNKSKNTERECLDVVIRHYPEIKSLGEIICTERPDFVIGDTGIEHFMVDTSTKGKKSITKEQSNVCEKRIEQYKQNPGKLDEDIENGNASKFVEKEVNRTTKAFMDFSYDKYIKEFRRIFNEHEKNIDIYKEKCSRLGFLVEMIYSPIFSSDGYMITDNGKTRKQLLKTMPITRDMIQIFKQSKAEFIYLYIKPYGTNTKKYEVVKLDMSDIESSIRKNRIIICDKFNYADKMPINIRVELENEKQED